jgi:pyruvate-formate lyase
MHPISQGRETRHGISASYTPYEGDSTFLQGVTERTQGLWQKLLPLLVQEREKGVLDVSQIPSGILAHGPGYIDKDREIIVGLQTDAPLKRAIMPFGGWRVVEASLKSYGYEPDPQIRSLRELKEIGPAPEPNLTVFWSPRLPEGFKRFAIKTSIDTRSIQYESDDLIRPKWGDDWAYLSSECRTTKWRASSRAPAATRRSWPTRTSSRRRTGRTSATP